LAADASGSGEAKSRAAAVRQRSNSGQTVVKQRSNSGQTAVRQRSNCGQTGAKRREHATVRAHRFTHTHSPFPPLPPSPSRPKPPRSAHPSPGRRGPAGDSDSGISSRPGPGRSISVRPCDRAGKQRTTPGSVTRHGPGRIRNGPSDPGLDRAMQKRARPVRAVRGKCSATGRPAGRATAPPHSPPSFPHSPCRGRSGPESAACSHTHATPGATGTATTQPAGASARAAADCRRATAAAVGPAGSGISGSSEGFPEFRNPKPSGVSGSGPARTSELSEAAVSGPPGAQTAASNCHPSKTQTAVKLRSNGLAARSHPRNRGPKRAHARRGALCSLAIPPSPVLPLSLPSFFFLAHPAFPQTWGARQMRHPELTHI
jgi:hypothetical protein